MVSQDWDAAVERVRQAQERAVCEPMTVRWRPPELDGDELDAGPDLAVALAARWSWVCPERFVNARLSDIDLIEDRLRGWCERPDGRTLAIAGEVGCGKTHLALAAARELHMASREVRFWPVVELWRKLRPGGQEGLIDLVSDVDVLVLDDLGSERATDWSAEQMWEIVNRRWLERRATVFTTNLAWSKLREVVGDRVYDRLVNAETVRVVLDGGSRRRGG
jgi:DNA replication protein DnaC